jgi:murein DD-endopeptidase MepM/ murein hydrolase activator NlpD
MRVSVWKVGLVALCWASMAAALPRSEPVPGGIALIPLGPAGLDDLPPAARFGGKRVMVVREGDTWVAVVGLPLATKPGPQRLDVVAGEPAGAVGFEVLPKAYAEQRLRIANDRMVNPGPAEMARINEETPRIRGALGTWSDASRVTFDFRLPVTAPASSVFGLRRFFNDEERNPHSGLDLAAAEGTPIVAPAAGVVLDLGEFYFNGNTVFIDHGRGLVTMYCHLQRIDVSAGQPVAAGEVIGAVGATGRVTAAHLHWGVALNGAMVDPTLFLSEAVPAGTP